MPALEQQIADRFLERQSEYAMLVNRGHRIGRINGLASSAQTQDSPTSPGSSSIRPVTPLGRGKHATVAV